MKLSLEQTLIEVWRQNLVENAKVVELGTERFAVRRTPKRGPFLAGYAAIWMAFGGVLLTVELAVKLSAL